VKSRKEEMTEVVGSMKNTLVTQRSFELSTLRSPWLSDRSLDVSTWRPGQRAQDSAFTQQRRKFTSWFRRQHGPWCGDLLRHRGSVKTLNRLFM